MVLSLPGEDGSITAFLKITRRGEPKPITLDAARNLDPSFKRPFGYVFLDRHPVLNAEIEKLNQEP